MASVSRGAGATLAALWALLTVVLLPLLLGAGLFFSNTAQQWQRQLLAIPGADPSQGAGATLARIQRYLKAPGAGLIQDPALTNPERHHLWELRQRYRQARLGVAVALGAWLGLGAWLVGAGRRYRGGAGVALAGLLAATHLLVAGLTAGLGLKPLLAWLHGPLFTAHPWVLGAETTSIALFPPSYFASVGVTLGGVQTLLGLLLIAHPWAHRGR